MLSPIFEGKTISTPIRKRQRCANTSERLDEHFPCHEDSALGSHYFLSLKMMGTWASLLGAETLFFLSLLLASLSKRGSFLGGSMVKNTPANVGDTGDVGREDPLEKGMATHSSILA